MKQLFALLTGRAFRLRCPCCKRWDAMRAEGQRFLGEEMVRHYRPISRKTARGRLASLQGNNFTLAKREMIEESRYCQYCGCHLVAIIRRPLKNR